MDFPLSFGLTPFAAGTLSSNRQTLVADKIHDLTVEMLNSEHKVPKVRKCSNGLSLIRRRDVIWLVSGASSMSVNSFGANGAGMPPEKKAKLCDEPCEKDLENVPMVSTESGLQYKDIKVGGGPSPPIGFQVAANYVAMVPSGQIFDSSLEKGQPYIFRVGSGQDLESGGIREPQCKEQLLLL